MKERIGTKIRGIELLLIIIIMGGINIFNILKYGGTIDNLKIVLEIKEINILISIIVNMILLLISYNYKRGIRTKEKSIENSILILIGAIGINTIIITNETILMYMALELYSITIYILIINKENILTRKVGIHYLIINTIASAIMLISIAYIYKYTGSLQIKVEEIITSLLGNNIIIGEKISIAYYLLIISLLFKLGIYPLSFWMIRLYSIIDFNLLFYQLLIPTTIYIIIISKMFNQIHQYIYPIYNTNLDNKYIYILIIITIASLLYSSISAVISNQVLRILAYSSIFNMSTIILIGLIGILNNNIIIGGTIIIEYIIIYMIGVICMYTSIKTINYYKVVKEEPMETIVNQEKIKPIIIILLISILSFIGIPPIGGFIIKLDIFQYLLKATTIKNITEKENIIQYIIFIGYILVSFISAFMYIKIIFHTNNKELNSSPISYTEESSGKIKPMTIISTITVIILTFYIYYRPIIKPYILLFII